LPVAVRGRLPLLDDRRAVEPGAPLVRLARSIDRDFDRLHEDATLRFCGDWLTPAGAL
jgi:hypothetical protein